MDHTGPEHQDQQDPRRSDEARDEDPAFAPSTLETEQIGGHDACTENETPCFTDHEKAAALEVTHSDPAALYHSDLAGADLDPVLSSPGPGSASLSEPERLAKLQEQHALARAALQGENDKRYAAVAKISDAQALIGRLLQEIHASRVELAIQIQIRDDALASRLQIEEQLRAIQVQIDDLTATPEERARRLARKEKERRHQEWLAKEEAFQNELVPFCRTYSRSTDHAGRPTKGFGTIHLSNRWIKIPRKDLPTYEAEQTEAIEWHAEERRDELADEYESHCKYDKQTWFRDRIQKATYLAAWGPNSPRARAYRERQRERGAPEADPPRYDRDQPLRQGHRPVPAVPPTSTPGW